jgi:hypothetical protein
MLSVSKADRDAVAKSNIPAPKGKEAVPVLTELSQQYTE